MKTSQGARRALVAAMAMMLLGFAGVAHAACAGGKLFKGAFGVTVNGPIVGQNTSELYNGILTADGKCGLSGSITGGVFAQPFVTQTVTGTYSIPKTGQPTVTLQLPDSSTAVVFDVGLTTDGAYSQVTGVASNGPAVATIEFVKIAGQSYGLGSLSGNYVATCTGASNDGTFGFGTETVQLTFDGAGHLTANATGNNNGHPFSVSLTATYTVGVTGDVFVQDGGQYTQYTASGEIVAGDELRDVLLQSGTGGGAYRTCVAKKQS